MNRREQGGIVMSKSIKVKPGKLPSKGGAIIGIIFVIIGVVLVIPVFGPFGILWTAVAGYIAFINFKNGFTQEGVATHEIIVEDDSVPSSGASGSGEDIESKLRTLESLYNQGLITSEEYEQKRKEVIDEF